MPTCWLASFGAGVVHGAREQPYVTAISGGDRQPCSSGEWRTMISRRGSRRSSIGPVTSSQTLVPCACTINSMGYSICHQEYCPKTKQVRIRQKVSKHTTAYLTASNVPQHTIARGQCNHNRHRAKSEMQSQRSCHKVPHNDAARGQSHQHTMTLPGAIAITK